MNFFEKYTERTVRKVAQQTSRRGFLGKLGAVVVGGASIPLLPVARAASNGYPGVASQSALNPGAEEGDVSSCDYWRYCGLGGALCSCCGGSANACPPGTEMSPLAWLGTCRNPVDGKNYIISYNDCCGKPICKRCLCDRVSSNPADRPVVRPQSSGSYIWCLGTKETTITCTTAIVVGVALDQDNVGQNDVD